MSMQQYCLRWNNHQPNFISVFSSLLNSESLVDVTLAAEGRHLQAHKVVLSACSSYFQSLFTINPCQHPIVILKDVKFADLKVMVDFMYYGEVNVSQEQLPHILKTAEMLKIKGLAEIPVDQSVTKNQTSTVDRAELLASGDPNWSTDPTRPSLSPSPACPLSPASKRKRMRKSSTGSASGSGDRGDENTGEVTLTSNASAATLSTVIKTDPGFATANSAMPKGNTKQHNTNTGVDLARGATHDTIESTDMPHQVTLVINQQVPQDVSVQHNLETTSSIDVAGSSTVTSISGNSSECTSTKRSRFLMRQPRIKRELDPDTGEFFDPPSSPNVLAPLPVRIERQCSDPFPASETPSTQKGLTVPSTLTKQHSQPLLPSQTHNESTESDHASKMRTMHAQHKSESSERVNPAVIVTEDTDPIPIEIIETNASSDIINRLRVKMRHDELRKTLSTPQTSGRLSHCPMVRPGPALGCNYCWNTVDSHGRILRRKTKYHCPECQTNLCIVPCFQEYHKRFAAVLPSGSTKSSSFTSRGLPKTSSL